MCIIQAFLDPTYQHSCMHIMLVILLHISTYHFTQLIVVTLFNSHVSSTSYSTLPFYPLSLMYITTTVSHRPQHIAFTQSTTPTMQTHTKQLFCLTDGSPGDNLNAWRQTIVFDALLFLFILFFLFILLSIINFIL